MCVGIFIQIVFWKEWWTRMHSSRMRSAHSLTVYHSRSACMHAPLPHMLPCHACPLQCMPPAMHAPYHACPLPCTPLPGMSPAMHAPCSPAMHAPCHACPHHAHPYHACPPVDRNLDTCYSKHYLAPNFICGGKSYNFMWPYLFCESVISDNWAQTGLNQFKLGFLSVISNWLIWLL